MSCKFAHHFWYVQWFLDKKESYHKIVLSKRNIFVLKFAFVMQVFGLVEMLEIKTLPRRSFLKVDFEERVAFWRGVQVLTGSLSLNLDKMSTTGAN